MWRRLQQDPSPRQPSGVHVQPQISIVDPSSSVSPTPSHHIAANHMHTATATLLPGHFRRVAPYPPRTAHGCGRWCLTRRLPFCFGGSNSSKGNGSSTVLIVFMLLFTGTAPFWLSFWSHNGKKGRGEAGTTPEAEGIIARSAGRVMGGIDFLLTATGLKSISYPKWYGPAPIVPPGWHTLQPIALPQSMTMGTSTSNSNNNKKNNNEDSDTKKEDGADPKLTSYLLFPEGNHLEHSSLMLSLEEWEAAFAAASIASSAAVAFDFRNFEKNDIGDEANGDSSRNSIKYNNSKVPLLSFPTASNPTFFFLWTTPWSGWRLRHYAFLDSVFVQNPTASVFFISTFDATRELREDERLDNDRKALQKQAGEGGEDDEDEYDDDEGFEEGNRGEKEDGSSSGDSRNPSDKQYRREQRRRQKQQELHEEASGATYFDPAIAHEGETMVEVEFEDEFVLHSRMARDGTVRRHLREHPLARYIEMGYKVHGIHVPPRGFRRTGWWTSEETKYWLLNVTTAAKPATYTYTHLTDYMRFFMMYKYGCIYTDTDALFLRPIPSGSFIGVDYSRDTSSWFIDSDNHFYTAPGLASLTRGLPWLKELMENTFRMDKYDGSCFNCVGPKALNIYIRQHYSSLVEKDGIVEYQQQQQPQPLSISKLEGNTAVEEGETAAAAAAMSNEVESLTPMTLFTPVAFYPVPFNLAGEKLCFKNITSGIDYETTRRRAFAIHLFGHTTGLVRVQVGSMLSLAMRATSLQRHSGTGLKYSIDRSKGHKIADDGDKKAQQEKEEEAGVEKKTSKKPGSVNEDDPKYILTHRRAVSECGLGGFVQMSTPAEEDHILSSSDSEDAPDNTNQMKTMKNKKHHNKNGKSNGIDDNSLNGNDFPSLVVVGDSVVFRGANTLFVRACEPLLEAFKQFPLKLIVSARYGSLSLSTVAAELDEKRSKNMSPASSSSRTAKKKKGSNNKNPSSSSQFPSIITTFEIDGLESVAEVNQALAVLQYHVSGSLGSSSSSSNTNDDGYSSHRVEEATEAQQREEEDYLEISLVTSFSSSSSSSSSDNSNSPATVHLARSVRLLIFHRLVTVMTHTHGRLLPFVGNMYDSVQEWFPGTRVVASDDSQNLDATSINEAALAAWQSTLDTVASHRPGLTVLPIPYDSGLSFARNHMVRHIKTRYVYLLDDDFVLTSASHLDLLLKILSTSDFDFASAVIPADIANFVHFRGFLKISPPDDASGEKGTLALVPGGYGSYHGCLHVDFTPNVFMARRQILEDVVSWDPDLKLGEHEEFFLRAKEAGVKILSCDNVQVAHHQVEWWKTSKEVDPDYARKRSRVFDYFKMSLGKHGLKKLVSFGITMAEIKD